MSVTGGPAPGRNSCDGRLVALAMMLTAVGILPVTVVPLLFPEMSRAIDGVDAHDLALWVTTFFVVSTVLSPLAGRGTDRWGASVCTVASALLTACALAVVVLAQNSLVMLAAMMLGGAGASGSITTSNLVMTPIAASPRAGLLFGIRQMAVPLMGLVSGSAAAVLLTALSWRQIVAALVTIPLAVVGLALLVRPAVHPVATIGGRLPLAADQRRLMWSLSGVNLLAATCVASYVTFSVTALTGAGWSNQQAAATVAVSGVIGVLTRVGSGWISDHWRRPRIAMELIAVLLLLLAISTALTASAGPVAVLIGVVVGYGGGWGYSALAQRALVDGFPGRVGRATGMVAVGTGAGQALGPMIFSGVAALVGVTAAWGTVGVLALISGALAWRAPVLAGRPPVAADAG